MYVQSKEGVVECLVLVVCRMPSGSKVQQTVGLVNAAADPVILDLKRLSSPVCTCTVSDMRGLFRLSTHLQMYIRTESSKNR